MTVAEARASREMLLMGVRSRWRRSSNGMTRELATAGQDLLQGAAPAPDDDMHASERLIDVPY